MATHNLLHNFGRRYKVDEALVDAHLVPVPRLGSLTTRLAKEFYKQASPRVGAERAYRFAGGDGEFLRR